MKLPIIFSILFSLALTLECVVSVNDDTGFGDQTLTNTGFAVCYASYSPYVSSANYKQGGKTTTADVSCTQFTTGTDYCGNCDAPEGDIYYYCESELCNLNTEGFAPTTCAELLSSACRLLMNMIGLVMIAIYLC